MRQFPNQDRMDQLGLTKAEKSFVCSLHAMGYRRVSRKYRTICRVDREDWLPFLASTQFDDYNWAYTVGPSFYRSVYSKDKIELPTNELMLAFCPSGHDNTIWQELSERQEAKLKDYLENGVPGWPDYLELRVRRV